MKIKANYIVISLVVFCTAFFGSILTYQGKDWYETIKLPLWTPSGSFISTVWTTIFTLTAVSAIIFYNKKIGKKSKFNKQRKEVIKLFFINGFLNVFWSYLFFFRHFILLAFFDAVFLALSVVALIILILPFSRKASFLLVPYALWVSFASYLNYQIWLLNK